MGTTVPHACHTPPALQGKGYRREVSWPTGGSFWRPPLFQCACCLGSRKPPAYGFQKGAEQKSWLTLGHPPQTSPGGKRGKSAIGWWEGRGEESTGGWGKAKLRESGRFRKKGFLLRDRKSTEGGGGKRSWSSTIGSHFWSSLSYPASAPMLHRAIYHHSSLYQPQSIMGWKALE